MLLTDLLFNIPQFKQSKKFCIYSDSIKPSNMVTFNATTTGDDVVKAFATEAKGKTGALQHILMIECPSVGSCEHLAHLYHIVLITGPSEGGVGAQTAISLAAGEPQEIILAGRNKDKVQAVIEQIQANHPNVKTTFAQVDLADQSSIRKAAKEISEKVQKLDVLINNAGGEFPPSPTVVQICFTIAWSFNSGTSHGNQRLHNDQGRHRDAIWHEPRRSLSTHQPSCAQTGSCRPERKNRQCL